MSKRGILTFLAALLSLSFLINLSPAFAIYGGTPATGNKVVIALLKSEMATNSGCSGGLVAPRIVMTATHCLTGSANNIWIIEPGVDIRDINTKRIQAEKIYLPEGFTAANFPYQNDFAIIVLKSGFDNFETLEIATSEQVTKWMHEEAAVTHIGYGCTALVDSPPCGATSPTPNQLETTFSKEIPQQFSSLISSTFSATKISVKKTTITCIKGKTVKKVTAVNPKCPTGYKKK